MMLGAGDMYNWNGCQLSLDMWLPGVLQLPLDETLQVMSSSVVEHQFIERGSWIQFQVRTHNL